MGRRRIWDVLTMNNQSQIATGSVVGMTQLVELRMNEYPTITGNIDHPVVVEIPGPFDIPLLVASFIK